MTDPGTDGGGGAGQDREVVILVPVFNDWEAVAELIPPLGARLAGAGVAARLLLVDDGSFTPMPEPLVGGRLRGLSGISVLRLRRNLGHQRALAIGLCHVEADEPCRAVVIMDGDGEDRPEDVPTLLDRMDRGPGRLIVFAERRRRSEGLTFRVGYWLYRQLHWLLTGVQVRIGNFSAIPAEQLHRLVAISDLWNHYAASVVRARLPMAMVPTARGRRLTGESKMNVVSLILHGLAAISVFSDRVGVRMILLTGALMVLAAVGLMATVLIRLLSDWAIPGWATTASGIIAIILFQLLTLLVVFVLITLRGREAASFLPIRDYPYFVERLERLDLDAEAEAQP